MPRDSDGSGDVVAAGATCRAHDCGELTVAYRSADSVGWDDAEPWEFTCPRCGIAFTVAEGDLVFQLVLKDWFVVQRYAA